jgi:hypothetical protein
MKTLEHHQQGLAAWQRYSRAARGAVLAFIWIQLIGFGVGLFLSRVVVSDLGVTVGLIAGALCGIGWVVLVEIGIRRSDANSPAIQNISKHFLRFPSVRVPFMLALGLMLGYGAIAWGLNWGINILLGTRSSQIVTVTGWASAGRSSCAHPQIGHSLFADSPRSLCVNAASRAQMPDGSRLRLVGTGSVLGLNVEEIYVENVAP